MNIFYVILRLLFTLICYCNRIRILYVLAIINNYYRFSILNLVIMQKIYLVLKNKNL